ncbi:MAG: type II toxin-antitoxin system PemK/MazF family toxin [Rickettsiales bacterium]
MSVKKYIPSRGDVVWMDFSPHAGSEQAGHRPALVLSSLSYNRIGLMLACPITSVKKSRPFQVMIKMDKINGFVLADHMKNQDWRIRSAVFAGKAPKKVLQETLYMISLLLTDD